MADTISHDPPVALVVTLSAVAVAMDSIDGPVARRTGTVTALGARFDGEVDAFLILALSVYVAPLVGAWVLAIGAARYVYGVGEGLLPWMRCRCPRARLAQGRGRGAGHRAHRGGRRRAAADARQVLAAGALALLAESFGRDLWWLWRRRRGAPAAVPAGAGRGRAGRCARPSPSG